VFKWDRTALLLAQVLGLCTKRSPRAAEEEFITASIMLRKTRKMNKFKIFS